MIRCSSIVHDEPTNDSITLDETARHRRRVKMISANGIEFLLDLPAATLLRDGDVLALDNGHRVKVKSQPESLYEIRGNNPQHLLQLAWHMGNRHLPTQIMADHIRIRYDAVIGKMIEQLGGAVRPIEAAFDPEGGAYGDIHEQANDDEHGHGHGHG